MYRAEHIDWQARYLLLVPPVLALVQNKSIPCCLDSLDQNLKCFIKVAI